MATDVCTFCRKHITQVTRLFVETSKDGNPSICSECVFLCVESLLDDARKLPMPKATTAESESHER